MPTWYTHDPWKCYLGWLSPGWAAPRDEFSAKDWCDKLEQGGFRIAVVHSKHHDGVCFFPSKYRDRQPERDYFGETVDEARSRGIRIVTYYSPIYDTWTASEHPEWQPLERDGSATAFSWSPFPIGAICHNHPKARAFMLGQMSEIQERYATDGFWIDGFDYTGFPSHACFCESCRDRFSRERNGRVLDDAYLTDELKLWQRDAFRELMVDIRRIACGDGTARVVVYNQAGANLELGYETIDELCSHSSTEAHSPATKSFMSRLLARRGKPFELYTPVSDKVISWTPRTTSMLRLEASIAVAHGGSILAGQDITPAGQVSAWQMAQLGEVGAYLRENARYLAGAKPVYDVGLLLPKAEWKNEEAGWAVALLRNQMPFALLPLDTLSFAGLRVVVVADGIAMSEDLALALEDYVSSGGSVVIERDAACVGDDFRLAELLGLRDARPTEFATSYLAPHDESLARDVWDQPVRADCRSMTVEPATAEVLASYAYPIAEHSAERWIWREPNPPLSQPSADPAATVNRFGAGRAAYLGCALSETLGRQGRQLTRLGVGLVQSLDDEPLLRSEAPSGVEVVVARGSGRHVVHMLNHYVDESSRFDRGDSTCPVVAGATVWVNESRVGPVARMFRPSDDADLDVVRDGDWLPVRVERLAVHEMVVLDATPAG